MTSTTIEQPRAAFREMAEGTAEDWKIISSAGIEFNRELPQRIIEHFLLLKADHGGFAVDRLEHCLQTATRAAEAGRDDEYVACALLHDIGDTLGSFNHADVAAAILEPFVSEKNHWMVKHHGILQGYYFLHFMGLDRNLRDQYREHEYYDYTVEFCAEYDQTAFDPDFTSMPLKEFEPLIEKLFKKPRHSLYLPVRE